MIGLNNQTEHIELSSFIDEITHLKYKDFEENVKNIILGCYEFLKK